MAVKVKPLESYDLSGKSSIVFQAVDLKKQALELDRLRREIELLNKSTNRSRLYPKRRMLFRHFLRKSLQQYFRKRYIINSDKQFLPQSINKG